MNPDPQKLVIVGHGAAGLAAAVSAAEQARSQGLRIEITLLEKSRETEAGGNTRWSPSYMRLAAPDRLAPGFEEDIVADSGGRADRAYVSRLAADATETIGWLERHGVVFHKPVYYLSAGPPRIQPVGGGVAILRELERAARDAGVVMRYRCRAERLLTGRSGAVEGVEGSAADCALETRKAPAVGPASGGLAR